MMLTSVLFLSSVLIASTPADCEELERVYIDVERHQEAGDVDETQSDDLLQLARRCAVQEGRHRSALEGYFLALTVLSKREGPPEPEACRGFEHAQELVGQMTVGSPNNKRFIEIQAALVELEPAFSCPEEPPAAKVQEEPAPVEPPAPIEPVPQPAPETRDVESPPESRRRDKKSSLRRGAIATGTIAGLGIISGTLITALARREVERVEAALVRDMPSGLGMDNNVCRLSGTQTSASQYCVKLNGLKGGMIASWSVAGVATISAIVLGSLYDRRRAVETQARVAPRIGIGRQGVDIGVHLRF